MRSNLETTERTDCFIPMKQRFAMTAIHVSSKPLHEFLNMTFCCHLLQNTLYFSTNYAELINSSSKINSNKTDHSKSFLSGIAALTAISVPPKKHNQIKLLT